MGVCECVCVGWPNALTHCILAYAGISARGRGLDLVLVSPTHIPLAAPHLALVFVVRNVLRICRVREQKKTQGGAQGGMVCLF